MGGIPLTCRAVFIIGPDKRLKLSLLYPATTGRNFDEILRVIDSLQLTATRKVATPVDWKAGGSCMVVPGVKQEDTAGPSLKASRCTRCPLARCTSALHLNQSKLLWTIDDVKDHWNFAFLPVINFILSTFNCAHK